MVVPFDEFELKIGAIRRIFSSFLVLGQDPSLYPESIPIENAVYGCQLIKKADLDFYTRYSYVAIF